MRKLLLSLVAVFLVVSVFAQQSNIIKPTTFFKKANPLVSTQNSGPLVVTPLVNIQDFITTMFGPGVLISNLTYTGAPLAIGKFTDTTGTLGMDSGIIMTSGDINAAVGPNNSNSAGYNNNLTGDSVLSSLCNTNTWDASIIEFDFVPLTDTIIACHMVFGSEEYPEFVGTFNDVFGFLMSGPGITGYENLAVVDTNGVIISVNSINATTNSQYYIDNSGGTTLQYDGYTTVIQFMRPIVNGVSYHFKIGIADAMDHVFDSGIFLKSKSFLSYAKMPVANFTPSPAGGNDVQFNNTTDYAKKYAWDFGDGTFDTTSLNPIHTYAAAGYYTVKLKAINYYQENTYTYTIAAGGVGINPVEPKPSMRLTQLTFGVFNLQLSNVTDANLQVFSIDGKVVKEISDIKGATDVTVDLTSLSKGLYVIKLFSSQGVLSQKIIR